MPTVTGEVTGTRLADQAHRRGIFTRRSPLCGSECLGLQSKLGWLLPFTTGWKSLQRTKPSLADDPEERAAIDRRAPTVRWF